MAGCGHPALRTRPKVRRRGGLYGRPCRVAFPAASPPNAVGRHAHMPPCPGRDDGGPVAPGGAARAHIQCAPTAGEPSYLGGNRDPVAAGGPMWASAPTQSVRELAWKFDNPHSGAKRRFRHADRGCLFVRQPLCDGAGYGSRTRLCSLGSCHSTDELIPHSIYILSSPHRKCNRFLSRSGENTFPQPSPGLGAVPQASRRGGVVQQSLQKLTRWTNPRPRATLGGNV